MGMCPPASKSRVHLGYSQSTKNASVFVILTLGVFKGQRTCNGYKWPLIGLEEKLLEQEEHAKRVHLGIHLSQLYFSLLYSIQYTKV